MREWTYPRDLRSFTCAIGVKGEFHSFGEIYEISNSVAYGEIFEGGGGVDSLEWL